MKVLLSINEWLLRRIDAAARARGLSRSAYLAMLAERDLGLSRGAGASPAVRRSLADLDDLFGELPSGDATAAIRAERDAR